MSEKHNPTPAEQHPVAWARMKHGKIISVSHDKGVAEFLAGFAASELVPLYLRPQPAWQQHAPDVAGLVEALERAHMALIGYLPGHRNDITDAAISHCEQALAAYHNQGGKP